jgi:hypothetical protein
MPKPFEKTYIPPYAKVRLVECHDHFQLVPVADKQFFCGYGKATASEASFQTEDGAIEPFTDDLGPDDELWMIAVGHLFQDGQMVPGTIKYLRPSIGEEDVIKEMEKMKDFFCTNREEMLGLTQCYESTKEDLDYIDQNYPNYQTRPTGQTKMDEQDLYDARLKVLSEFAAEDS